ncbi:MAG: hypothetical protein IPP79_20605 [Chitinophagaceae bacterium]|nr:hypothetical protein [Chitinophagaceae bacterium]
MKYRFLVFVLINIVFQAAAQTLEIPFAENKPQIDGNLEEWNMSIDLTDTKQALQYRNTNHVACLWDNEFLYIAFQIQDACLTENEKGNDNPRLYFNDAVEIYIDTHNDSKEKMDINDYQFIISLTGESVIFKGDKEQIKEGNSVPKDVGIANIVFITKTAVHGSINNLMIKMMAIM